MALIAKTSIDLTKIPKDKIIEGKKGKYLPITITFNDEFDNYGNNGPVIVEQSQEEREAKEAKVYLGNVKVVWSNDRCPQVPPRDGQAKQGGATFAPAENITKAEPSDLPF